MTPRTTSGSSRSPSSVDPTTSQKSTVTVFRTSRAGSASRGAPHELQNRAPAGFSRPHCVQMVTGRVYGVAAGGRPFVRFG